MKIQAMLLAVLLCMPAIVSAQGSTASINGTWDIVMNGFGGKITFSSGGGVLNMSGYPQEKINDLRFDGSTIRFIRVSSLGPTCDQVFTGTVSGNTMKGTLTMTSTPGSIYQWNATRPGGAQVPVPPDEGSAIPSLTGPWVHSADAGAQTPDSKVIVVQDGNRVTMTHTWKTNGRWVTLVCQGQLSGSNLSMKCVYAPGGNPFGFGNGTMNHKLSSDGNHLDGAITSNTGGSQESHYSRLR